jgi:GNAT superfamily N-acetyltransferase
LNEDIVIRPVTAENWDDLARFFQGHGNPNYCWCMTWRVSSREFRGLASSGRQAALRERVLSGQPVGLLAYDGDEPVGWCSVAPRESYARLERSPKRPRLDDRPTWSVVCFFLAPGARGRSLPAEMLRQAVRVAGEHGAQVVEGYPVDPVQGADGESVAPPSFRFMGYRRAFEQAGFSDVTPPGNNRTIMRAETSPTSKLDEVGG